MARKKVEIPVRDGKPTSCIVCGNNLHRKSEYYCSKKCENKYLSFSTENDLPPFLSKWKIRKIKELKDPTIQLRQKIRRKTKDLLIKGKLKRKPCVVCKNNQVVPHHEDYSNPYNIIWLCEKHHKEYHDGKIALLNGTLKWNSNKLLPRKLKINIPKKKYQNLKKSHEKKITNNLNTD